jgi:transcriptional antiterminator NusG
MSEKLEGTTIETDAEEAVNTPETEAAPEQSEAVQPTTDSAGAPDEAPTDSAAEQNPLAADNVEDDHAEDEALRERAAAAFGLAAEAETAEEETDEVQAEVSEETEDEEEFLIPDDGREWFVIHCYSGYENKVRHSIEQRIETMDMQDKIFDVVVPTEEEIEIKDGKRRTVERRVFPGYILVQMLMSEDSWYVVRNTPGVTGFVGMGNDPTPLRPDEVAKIMNRMEAEAPKVKFDFQIGEKVRIGTGPFADFIGTVAEIDADRAKVRVMVSFFGRETPVELDFLHVEKV